MKKCLFLIAACWLITSIDASGQSNPVSPDPSKAAALAEAEELNAQVTSLYNERKYDKALTLAKKVLQIREKALGPDHFLVVDALANVGELLYLRGPRREAVKTYRRYLQTYDKNRSVDLRDTRSQMILALNRFICALMSNLDKEYEDFDEAYELQKRLYKVENGFDFDEGTNRPLDKLRRGGLLINKRISGPMPISVRSRIVLSLLILKITVDEQGKVVAAKTICGDQLVAEASEEAILRTTYKPTIVDGKAVPVTALAVYQFIPH